MLRFWYVNYFFLLFCFGFELQVTGNAINCCLLWLLLEMSYGMLDCVFVLVDAIYVSGISVVFQLLWLIYIWSFVFIFCVFPVSNLFLFDMVVGLWMILFVRVASWFYLIGWFLVSYGCFLYSIVWYSEFSVFNLFQSVWISAKRECY